MVKKCLVKQGPRTGAETLRMVNKCRNRSEEKYVLVYGWDHLSNSSTSTPGCQSGCKHRDNRGTQYFWRTCATLKVETTWSGSNKFSFKIEAEKSKMSVAEGWSSGWTLDIKSMQRNAPFLLQPGVQWFMLRAGPSLQQIHQLTSSLNFLIGSNSLSSHLRCFYCSVQPVALLQGVQSCWVRGLDRTCCYDLRWMVAEGGPKCRTTKAGWRTVVRTKSFHLLKQKLNYGKHKLQCLCQWQKIVKMQLKTRIYLYITEKIYITQI